MENNIYAYSNTNLINFYGASDSNKILLSSGDYLQRKKGYVVYKDIRRDLLNNIQTPNVSKSKNGKVIFPGNQDMNIFRKAKSTYLNNNECLKNELDPSTNKINDEGSGILYCPEIGKNTKLGGLENFNGVADFATVLVDVSFDSVINTKQYLSVSNNADGDLVFQVTNSQENVKQVSVINDLITPVFGLDCNSLPHFNKYYTQPNPNSLYGTVDGDIFNFDFSLDVDFDELFDENFDDEPAPDIEIPPT